MYDAGVSQGHVRLCDAVDAGVPVVASRTRSLEGYVEDGRTAVLVDPGDAGALRLAVDGLLSDPAGRERLAQAAFERAAAWTWPDYLAAIEAFGRRADQR
jgi:glycosyltransferase involved in cell wall biosynthesis